VIPTTARALAQPSPLSPLAAPPEPPKASLPISPTPQKGIVFNGGPLKGGTKGGIMVAAFGLPRACCCAQKRTALRATLVGCARVLACTSVNAYFGSGISPSFSPSFGALCTSRARRYSAGEGFLPTTGGVSGSCSKILRRRRLPAGRPRSVRISGFNLKHAVGLSEHAAGAACRDTPPSEASSRETVGYMFPVKIKRRTWRLFPFRKLVLYCY